MGLIVVPVAYKIRDFRSAEGCAFSGAQAFLLKGFDIVAAVSFTSWKAVSIAADAH